MEGRGRQTKDKNWVLTNRMMVFTSLLMQKKRNLIGHKSKKLLRLRCSLKMGWSTVVLMIINDAPQESCVDFGAHESLGYCWDAD